MTQLLPCYYCGTTPEVHSYSDFEYFVRCFTCGTHTEYKYAPNEDAAIQIWNERMTRLQSSENHKPLQLEKFLDRVHKFNLNLYYDDHLKVFMFDVQNSDLKKQFQNVITEKPEYERALLWQKTGRGTLNPDDELSSDDMSFRRMLYGIVHFWDKHETLSPDEQIAKRYWDDVIDWLKHFGGAYPSLAGALDFAMNPGQVYPKSFPNIYNY